ncbi:MarR family winged helix-turn-helix transcriptional regulator [Aquabacterium sp.]|uniref:MarR family winged helix-turn-helix transcriptional regulator n=1 Tax=Aquabacterium sp. TaxID=1872578 RepID=UPI001983DB4B|nr:MarR family winged helix-turn-helix transcriptional regulator [Aquabacterium sp.]MBC7699011.1 winged helix-turn-helix transcriptional regulator [Aquabacterium sp.]
MAHRPRLVFLLNSAQRRLQQWIGVQQAEAARDGITAPTPAQGGVLFCLAREDGATMGQLADTLDLAPSAVSGLVQRMEALDWVARHPCPQDGRTQRVWLRPAGLAQQQPLREAMVRINARLTTGFTDAELQTVARWLSHVQHLDSPSSSGKNHD